MSNRAFTLIEILIAVAIIAVLIGVGIPNFLGIRTRARDARRKSDVSQLQKSIELFKEDQDPPVYPDDAFMDGLCRQCWSQSADGTCGGNVYIRKLPCDPQSGNPYFYVRNPDDSLQYTLVACLENSEDSDKDPVADPACVSMDKVSYTIYEP